MEKGYRALTNILYIPVSTIGLVICSWKVHGTTTNHSRKDVILRKISIKLMVRTVEAMPAVT